MDTLKHHALRLDFAVAQICHYYPGEFRNGEIGWKFFWMLYHNLPNLIAIQKLALTNATILSGIWVNTDDAGRRKLETEIQKMEKLAQGDS